MNYEDSRREKVIVFVTSLGFDSSFALLAERRDGGTIVIEGKQLKLAVTPEKDAALYDNDWLYEFSSRQYKVKCYDCYKFSALGKHREPLVDEWYIMRCQGYHPETGSPGFLPSEAHAAGVPAFKIQLYTRPDGLLYIRPSMLQAC